MALALALGERHLGLTWPNPSVGAVLVRPGSEPVIVGQGITQAGGRPHAERVALGLAGEAARGATLYVTLEPCSHHGRTPPCVDAVIESGVARVVAALGDPDPRVAGRGLARLRQAGIAVTEGVGQERAALAHRGHVLRVTQGRPFVTLKLARTRDGFAGRRDGARLRITGEAANARVHLLRAHADAILVGVGTVLADDPLLTVRLPGLERRSPVRIVLDSRLRTSLTARVATGQDDAQTWLVAAPDAPEALRGPFRERGIEIMEAGASSAGLDLAAVLGALAERGLTRLFVEGGPTLADALAAADLIDEVMLLTGPAPLNEPGLPAIGPRLGKALATAFRLAETDLLGQDRLERFEKVV